MTAAENGHHGVCDYLINRGADVNLVDKHGMLLPYLHKLQCDATKDDK